MWLKAYRHIIVLQGQPHTVTVPKKGNCGYVKAGLNGNCYCMGADPNSLGPRVSCLKPLFRV